MKAKTVRPLLSILVLGFGSTNARVIVREGGGDTTRAIGPSRARSPGHHSASARTASRVLLPFGAQRRPTVSRRPLRSALGVRHVSRAEARHAALIGWSGLPRGCDPAAESPGR